jgi:ribonuclease Z
MVQVTFMGTGAAFATRHRTNIALLVQEDDTHFVVECGPAILHQLDRAGLAAPQVNYLFISHHHGDHILGLPMFLLMYAMSGRQPGPLTIIGNENTLRAGRELTRIVYPETNERLGGVTWASLPPDRAASLELEPSLALSTLPTPHSPNAPVLALRLELRRSGRSLVYTGDTSYNEKIASFAAGCDLLVHESNFSQTLQPEIVAGDYGHSTARQAGRTAALAGCRTLALVHTSPAYAGQEGQLYAEAAQEFDGQIIIPNDGATVYL